MSLKLLTNLIFEPKGVHDPALTYSIKDTVMSPDGSKVYFALRDVPSGIALTDKNYWMLQIDLSGSKNAMDEAVAAFADYAKIVGTRVKGETTKATGNPVSFLPDAGSLLQPVTVLEPQQSGSGDPYPAGGGRNLLNVKRLLTPDGNASNINVTLTGSILTLEGTPTGAFSQIQENNIIDAASLIGKAITFSGILGGQEPYIAIQCKSANATLTTIALSQTGAATGIVPEGTTKIAIAACLNQSNYVGSACKATYENLQLEIGSSATEYQPWENIRPFIGYDKLDLNHAGKNLAHLTFRDVIPSVVSGNDVAVSAWASDYIFIGENNVVMSRSSATNATVMYLLLYDSAKKYIGYVSNSIAGAASKSVDVSGYENARYCRVRFDEKANTDVRVQLEIGSTASDFQPYQGTLHTVQIGQTVYGGKLDWLTGKLVAEWAMKTLDGTEAFQTSNYGAHFYIYDATMPASSDGSVINVTSSHFKGVAEADRMSGNPLVYLMSGYNAVEFRNSVCADVTEWKAYLAAQHAAGTPVQIVYKLAQPIEIQLTPHIISAVDPEQTNTLYGDGTIEVEYVKPLHVSIEERVAAALAAAAQTE